MANTYGYNPYYALTILSRTDELGRVRAFVREAALQFGFSAADAEKIVLATDEACANVIRHGYNGEPFHFINISIETNGRAFAVVIDDDGKSYDLRTHIIPDTQQYFKERQRGGLGIKLIRLLVDEIDYIADGSHNRLRLTKRLPNSSE
ncbi:MAG: ATP-binding protein [Chloroherpetonaceae bacterium]|nr:ATP-binding protein [Chloroherpetonaceae bacterium]MCS7211136.1 ATP-binding protein [Chloroherpetonaceae bacterium]MDW8020950.1 ATP-binding protein [Chloroherpetonaceae bacterium]MDW8465567.1 ATP-binding protein [Chloroherpetonaceae bacterium]